MFLPAIKESYFPFKQLSNLKLKSEESVEGDDCYVVSGSSPASKEVIYWISKKSYLIRKHSRSLELSGEVPVPELTDAQIDLALENSGQVATAETRKAMKDVMRLSIESMRNSKLKGTSVEIHKKIDTSELTDKDFAYQVPAGTKLSDELISGK